MGRLPRDRVPRRRRGVHAVARPQAARSLLPGARRPAEGRPAGALRRRRRGRHRPRRSARVRVAAAAHPPGRVAGQHAGRGVAGQLRRLGPARARRRGPARCAPGRAADAAGDGAGGRAAAGPPHAGDPRPRRRPPTGSTGSRAPGSTASSPSALDAPYQPGKRAMLKIKHQRTADCVVAGFRWHKNGPGTHIGSLLLGLFDDAGKLNHVGITSSFSWDRRAELAEELAPLRENAVEGHPVEGMGRVGRLRATPRRRASGCPARRRAGTGARTCRGSRSAPSAWSRSPTTTSRATASGTPRRSSAGVPTSPRRSAATTSSRRRVPFELEAIFGQLMDGCGCDERFSIFDRRIGRGRPRAVPPQRARIARPGSCST